MMVTWSHFHGFHEYELKLEYSGTHTPRHNTHTNRHSMTPNIEPMFEFELS